MKLGKKIQAARKQRGLSQEQLAEQLTVSRQAISKWELDESVPDTENIVQLTKLFGVSADYLLNDDYESDGDIPAVKMTVADIRQTQTKRRQSWCYGLIAFGLAGVFTLWILSSAIVARKTVPDYKGGPSTEVVEIYGEAEAAPEGEGSGTTYFWTTIEVRGDLGAFLQTYSLVGLFALCCASAAGGGLGLAILAAKERKRLKTAVQ
jgi:transcriptional regulator with XRE-family HTH domain